MNTPSAPSSSRRPLSHRRPAAVDRFWFGAPYYPEHESAERLASDPARIAAAGMNVVRMGEFAWDLLEPEEGRFEFALFDATIAAMGAAGVSTFFCSPTAAPPRWLTARHPEILRIDRDCRPMQHGSRQHASTAHPLFREHSRKITTALATHYASNPHVVGWQTDNELNCHISEDYCPAAQHGFRSFLRAKYGDIATLNRIWGTAFWALTYQHFDQIEIPRDQRPTWLNPAAHLDYFRYISADTASFQREQVEILRATNPNWLIFHNGMFSHVDYRGDLVRDLDVVGIDVYPFFNSDPVQRPRASAFSLDRARAWSGNFVVPEQQSGPGGQPGYFHDHPEPGEVRALAWQSIAHGADGLQFFRWRTCHFGAEQYWCGVLDHDDVPRRRYAEVSQLGAELKRIAPLLLGTEVVMDVAFASADQEVADSHQTYSLGLPWPDQIAEQQHIWFQTRGYSVGCVHPSDDLSGLKLYVIPHWAWFDPAWLPNLHQFVESGGVLVIGARTATRDIYNNIVTDVLPGCLRELTGVSVVEYGRLNRQPSLERTVEAAAAGGAMCADHWYEQLELSAGVQTLATWRGRTHLNGTPAISSRTVGKGRVVYVGTYLHAEVWNVLGTELTAAAGVKPLVKTAENVQVSRRVAAAANGKPARELWTVVNLTNQAQAISGLPAAHDLITDTTIDGERMLPPFCVQVLRVR